MLSSELEELQNSLAGIRFRLEQCRSRFAGLTGRNCIQTLDGSAQRVQDAIEELDTAIGRARRAERLP